MCCLGLPQLPSQSPEPYPDLLFLVFWDFLTFFFYKEFLAFSASFLSSQEENPPEEIHPKWKSSSDQVFLNSFGWVPDSFHNEEGKSSRKLFRKIRVNAVLFWYLGILGALLGLYFFPKNLKFRGSGEKKIIVSFWWFSLPEKKSKEIRSG